MGGNAIKKVKISRLNLETYNLIKKEICDSLSPIYELEFAHEIPDKKDFGDIDILYKDRENINLRKILTDKYNPIEFFNNGLVLSIAYLYNNEYYQVDFVKCSNLRMSKFFFSYGDLGGVVGTITKFYGISYGEGLWINVSKETIEKYLKKEITDYSSTKIFLSDDPEEICKYLNLDYERWKLGFEDKIYLFQWVINSSWFYKDIFRNLNSLERKKTLVRPFYRDFNEYIFNEINNIGKQELIPILSKNRQLETLHYFNKIDLLNKIIEENKKKIERKKKYNGLKFMKYGYCDKEIGTAIIEFKKYIDNKYNNSIYDHDFFNTWLDYKLEEEVDIEIYNFIIQ